MTEQLRSLFERWRGDPFAIRLWDGQQWRPDERAPRFTVIVREPAALAELLSRDLEAIGEAYVAGALDVEGDLLGCFLLLDHLVAARPSSPGPNGRGAGRTFTSTRAAHTVERAREAVNFHYELPGAFFALFLDVHRVYSCAYFRNAEVPLDEAQLDKLDLVCRKLRLRPGESLLDLGCGWGALAVHAATQYGVAVTGITLSELQAEYAREQIAKARLSDRCRIHVTDFRELDRSKRFDKIASVGAVEHVGEQDLPLYFQRCHELLVDDGLMLNHGISARPTRPLGAGNTFQRRYIFPDHALVPVSTMLGAAEAAEFEVRDVESLREHYALTLAAWYRRLETNTAPAIEHAGEATTRAFKAYLAGTSHAFRTGDLDLHQSLLAKSPTGATSLPLTRADLYRDPM